LIPITIPNIAHGIQKTSGKNTTANLAKPTHKIKVIKVQRKTNNMKDIKFFIFL
jgi:hypothetical protein